MKTSIKLAMLKTTIVLWSCLVSAFSYAYEINLQTNAVRADIASAIDLVFWIKPGVQEHEIQPMIDEIMRGATLWNDIPTACINFHFGRWEQSHTEPVKTPEELMVIVRSQSDLTSGGGASLPMNGFPGTWFGAVTTLLNSPNQQLAKVASHELGHAVGFHHSSISGPYATSDSMPAMAWNLDTRPVAALTADDIAAASIAYPCSDQPLALSSGRVIGRLVTNTGVPVSGINAVAYNLDTDMPAVARISGQFADQGDGEFDIAGLPPGRYRIDFMDANYYGGIRSDRFWLHSDQGAPYDYRAAYDYQADNFSFFSSEEFQVATNATVALGDRVVAIEPIRLDQANLQANGELPVAYLGEPFSARVRVLGGVRGLRNTRIASTNGNNGLHMSLLQEGYFVGPRALTVTGTPTQPGPYSYSFILSDMAGNQQTFTLAGEVACRPTAPSLRLIPALPTTANLDQPLEFDLAITNNDVHSSCGTREFDIELRTFVNSTSVIDNQRVQIQPGVTHTIRFTKTFATVGMHGLRITARENGAVAVSLPLHLINVTPPPCTQSLPTAVVTGYEPIVATGDTARFQVTVTNNDRHCAARDLTVNLRTLVGADRHSLIGNISLASGASGVLDFSYTYASAGSVYHHVQIFENDVYLANQAIGVVTVNTPVCTQSVPTAVVTGYVPALTTGDTAQFQVTVTNNDRHCAARDLAVIFRTLVGIERLTLPGSLTLSPGASGVLDFQYTYTNPVSVYHYVQIFENNVFLTNQAIGVVTARTP